MAQALPIAVLLSVKAEIDRQTLFKSERRHQGSSTWRRGEVRAADSRPTQETTPAINQPVRILLVDDHPLFRRGLRVTIEACSWLRLVGEANHARAGVRMAEELVPDVILLNLCSGSHLVGSILALRQRHVQGSVIALMANDREMEHELIASGADTCLPKTATASELLNVIRGLQARKRLSKQGGVEGLARAV